MDYLEIFTQVPVGYDRKPFDDGYTERYRDQQSNKDSNNQQPTTTPSQDGNSKTVSGSLSTQQMALIAAAGLAMAGGSYFGFQRYSRAKRLSGPSADPSKSIESCVHSTDDARHLSDAERRRARADKLKKQAPAINTSDVGTFAVCAALALAAKVLKRE